MEDPSPEPSAAVAEPAAAEAPAVPATPEVLQYGATSAVLKWAPGPARDNVTGYIVVLVGGAPLPTGALPRKELETSARVASLQQLTALTPYTVWLRALTGSPPGSVGRSEWSEPLEFTTMALPPDVPEAPAIAADGHDHAMVTISPPMDNGMPIEWYQVRWWGLDQYGVRIPCLQDEAACQHSPQGATTVRIGPLAPGGRYVFAVAASNQLGMSAFSPLAGLVLDALLPAKPAPPEVVKGNASQLTVNFTPRTGEVLLHWCLLYGRDPQLADATAHDVSLKTTALPLVNLQCSAEYYFAVTVSNTSGESPRSDIVSCVVAEPTLPARPAAPVAQVTDATSCLLRWNAPIDQASVTAARIKGYEVRVRTRGASERDVKLYEFTSQEGTIGDLEYFKDYLFDVRAGNVTGFGPWSEPSNMVQMPVPVPDAPGQPFVRRPTHHSVLIQWQHPAPGAMPIETFRIRYCDGSDRFAARCTTEIHHIPNKMSSYTIKNLEHGKTYYMQISAVSKLGQGRWSETSPPIRTLEGDVPAKVRDLTRLFSYASFITLSWAAVEDNGFPVVKNRVRYAYEEDMSEAVESMPAEGTVTQCPIKHLAKGKVYFFQVAAVNKLGTGGWSDPLRIEVPAKATAAIAANGA